MSDHFFIVPCPCGDAEFPVDPGKVPEGGIHARCSVCSAVFLVEVPSRRQMAGVGAPGSGVSAPHGGAGVEDYFEPVFSEEGLEEVASVPLDVEPGFGPAHLQTPPASVPVSPPSPPSPPAPPPMPEVGFRVELESPAPTPPVFGRRDPHDKARRLARVLVSDMVTYHRERHARALAAGTLAEDFDEEIRKSWEEYVMQVGKGLAEETTYFRDALNEILAGGKEIF